MIDLTLPQLVMVTLVLTHTTMTSVTLYLHRCLSHRGVEFHPVVSHFFRAWLWLTTAMNTKQWVAVHRYHHQNTDVVGDPHSPHVFGILTVMFSGMHLYNKVCKEASFSMKYGTCTPKDWIERKLYTPYTSLGIFVMLAIDLLLFGTWGIVVWTIQIAWIPVFAAAMINGLGHWCGYRNGDTNDRSRNISPIGVIVCGEELHNNHHLDPASPKFSRKHWEFDIGWMYIRILTKLGLAKITITNQNC